MSTYDDAHTRIQAPLAACLEYLLPRDYVVAVHDTAWKWGHLHGTPQGEWLYIPLIEDNPALGTLAFLSVVDYLAHLRRFCPGWLTRKCHLVLYGESIKTAMRAVPTGTARLSGDVLTTGDIQPLAEVWHMERRRIA